MLVRTLKAHFNGYGETYAKKAGDVYDHPSPAGLIATGRLEIAGAAKPKRKRTRRAKKA